MKITCPSCAAKYSIADEKVVDRLAKIRCRKCGTTIVIDGKVDPANVYAADSAPDTGAQSSAPPADSAAGGEYSVDFGDNDQRTLTVPQLVEAYNNGEVTADTYVWADGMDDWRPLGEVDEIVNALHSANDSGAAAAPAAAVAPAAVAAPAAAFGGGAAGFSPAPAAPAPSSPFDASSSPFDQGSASPWANDSAPKPAARAGTADLFGGFAAAGSEEDVTTSAPAEQASSAPATGARNESSVLFSLSALTAGAGDKPSDTASFGGGSSGVKEDSGLIDLKALTSQVETDRPMDNPLLGSTGLGFGSPLGLSAPLGGGLGGGLEAPIAAPIAAAEPQKNKTGLFIGGAIALAAIVIGGAIVLSGSKETPAPAAETTPTATATQTAAATTATAAPTLTAEAPATGTAVAEQTPPADEKGEDTKAAADTPTKTATNTGTNRPATQTKTATNTSKSGSSNTGSAAATSKPATTATSKPATTATSKPAATSTAKKCNCPAGDLMCAMRCRAG